MTWETAFIGRGEVAGDRAAPGFTPLPELKRPDGYLADTALTAAVNVALLLGQPLLVTGEPGTGKSLLAHRIAWEFGQKAPLVFIARTTSTAIDLFYHFDALRRFLDAQAGDKRAEDPGNYVTYQALGLAILLAMPAEMAGPYLPEAVRGIGPVRSVVLIDEIDKAPRDLPNDILNEVDAMEFTVRETGRRFPDFEAEERRMRQQGLTRQEAKMLVDGYRAIFERNRPVIVLTSNDEQRLPPAFLRRCVYHHIAFPDADTPKGRDALKQIVVSRLEKRLKAAGDGYSGEEYLQTVLEIFGGCRAQLQDKKPATAELIAWVWMLAEKRLSAERLRTPDAGTLDDLKTTASVLVKSKEDRDSIDKYLRGWVEKRGPGAARSNGQS